MKTVGIIGGLGPQTTAEFYLELIFSSYKINKTSRPPILIWNVPLRYRIEQDLIMQAKGEERHQPADVRKTFERVLAYPEVIALVASDKKRLPLGAAIAFAMDRKPELDARLSRPGKGLFVNELFVGSFARHRGIAAALAAELVSAARSEEFDYAVVSTSIHEPTACHLFSDRHGFEAAMLGNYFAFRIINLRKLCSSTVATNTGSIATHKKCGCVEIGRRRLQRFRSGSYVDEILFEHFADAFQAAWNRHVFLLTPDGKA